MSSKKKKSNTSASKKRAAYERRRERQNVGKNSTIVLIVTAIAIVGIFVGRWVVAIGNGYYDAFVEPSSTTISAVRNMQGLVPKEDEQAALLPLQKQWDLFTAARLRDEVTVTADDKSKTYGGTDPALTATVTGLVNGEGESVLTYAVTRDAGEDAGTYAITASGDAEQGNYTVSYEPGVFTIARAPLTITARSRTKTYGQSITLNGETGFTMTPETLRDGDSVTSVTLTSEGAAADAAAGAYQIVASNAQGTGLANYEITYAPGTLTVSRRQVTITANAAGKVYGARDPALTATVVLLP